MATASRDCYQYCCYELTINAVVTVVFRLLAVGLQVGDGLVDAGIKGSLQEVGLSDAASTLLPIVPLQA